MTDTEERDYIEGVALGGASSRGSHRLAATHGCDRYWALRYHYGWVSTKEPWYRLLGTMIHLGLQYYWGSRLEKRPDWLDQDLDAQLHELAKLCPERQDLVSITKQCVAAYITHHRNKTWKPVACEHEFRATVGQIDPGGRYPELNKEVVTCRSDLVVEHNDQYWIIDFKTVGGDWRTKRLAVWNQDKGKWRVSWQALVNLHVVGLNLTDKPVGGFIINRVKRDDPFDFDSHVLDVSPKVLEDARALIRDSVHRERNILADIACGMKPVPNFAMCSAGEWGCDYADLCLSATDKERDTIFKSRFKILNNI